MKANYQQCNSAQGEHLPSTYEQAVDCAQYQPLKLKDVIEPNPPTCHSSGGVMDAIARMNQHDGRSSRRYSYVLIVEELKLVGIITEQDIVKLTVTGADLAQTKIKEVMTTKLVTLSKSDLLDIHAIMTLMRQHKIRQLPIVDEQRYLAGLISVNTICRALHPSNLLKFRRVDEAMTTEVFQALANTSVLSLSQMMVDNKTSCIIIVDCPELQTQSIASSLSAKPVGIVTERDIVQFQVLGIDIANTTARAVMSSPLVCVKTTDSLMEVRSSMERLRVRRLVIVSDSGELRGIISQYNMLKVIDPTELFGVIETLQTELEERTNQLEQEKELAQITLQSIGDAVITTDAVGKIVNFNPMAEKLTGWNLAEANGKLLSDVFLIIDEYTRAAVTNPVEKALRENKAVEVVDRAVLIARDGTEYAIEDSAAPIRDREGKLVGTVIIFRDVTESRSLNARLSWQANHDTLTGLCNRREFKKRLLKAISSSGNEGDRHILCYLDLDRFKIINDTCGHNAGDELLKQVTNLLLQQVRSSDILARLGGDEFGLLLNQCPLSVATRIANNLRQQIEDFRFNWQGRTFSIGVSIGLVEISSSTQSLSAVMNAADAACYVAKANGRNRVRVYRGSDTKLTQNLGQRQWIARLNRAIEQDRFCLYTQKIICIQGELEPRSSANYYEILLRLQDGGQLVLPNAFIPTAESYNLMFAIDCWVIEHFMASYRSHCQDNPDRLSDNIYAINISSASISINSQQFLLFLKQQLDYYRVDPSTICFEIAETTVIANLAIAAKFLTELRQIGFSTALDNFGSSVSSLGYLENLSVDCLKIDGSLVKNMLTNQVARATVEYLNRVARIMKMTTVAKFVEEDAILPQLQEIGVDYAQGYQVARPIPLAFDLRLKNLDSQTKLDRYN